ncbi:MAG TPA: hypothetical protein PK781_04245 [Terrimesophilobacter sp.]|nr:hypothetical protein [Terrimesophilobacter sp.]
MRNTQRIAPHSPIDDYAHRFSLFEMSKAERDTLHAKNERMRVVTFLRGIEFYRALVRGL